MKSRSLSRPVADCPERYDAILTGVRMPLLDGISATRNIRGLRSPAARAVPSIAMTAPAFKEDKTVCLEAGMNGHRARPIAMEKLFATLTRFFAVPARNLQTEGA